MDGLLYLVVIGLVAGWLASLILKTGFSLLGYLLVGVIGSYIGGFLFDLLGISTSTTSGRIFSAAVGALVFLFILGRIRK